MAAKSDKSKTKTGNKIDFMRKPHPKSLTTGIMKPLFKRWFFGKFTKYSEPQKYSIYNIHSRINTLISSPTGSGKTLSAFGAILNELIDHSGKGKLEDRIYCVYVSPLKALSYDIEKNLLEPLEEMQELHGKSLGIRVAVRTGDTTPQEKAKMLKHPPHILITTPESLAILLASVKFKEKLKDVSWCIVDEIHSIAENKRGTHLSLSLERLQRLSPGMARIGLSATVAPLDDIARFLVGNRDCKVVDVQFIKQMDLKVLSPVPDLIDVSHESMHNKMYNLIDKLVMKHKTTLIFTNTRAATERVVHYLKDKFPKHFNEVNIGAHHGSLSKEHRQELEENLRQGKLKCVVCSTSLELGIDIGYIDLVLLLGSPKSVARALQRIGRSGHQLHATTKGRIIVLDRDDLVECSVLLKSALERKIDRIHIPENCLDVLVQHIHGISLEGNIDAKELFDLFKQSYCYRELQWSDFIEVVEYLAGRFISLEDRHVYAKVFYDEEKGIIGRKGRMSRVIHMTNIGTIPDQSGIKVKVGGQIVGTIDEGFLERMSRGDIFVLGGNTYMFRHTRGMTAVADRSYDRPPTVPRWVSEMLPLSFDLAMDIGRFRRLMSEKFQHGETKHEILNFLNDYLYVDSNAAESIYRYFAEQYYYAKEMPSDKNLIIEHYIDEHERKHIIFHTLFGRRVNDCLSRALAFAISRTQHRDVEMGINDNGFYLTFEKNIQALRALKLLKEDEIDGIMNQAIEKTEIMKRRFRHCAGRALMILRNYMGRTKNVGRQQMGSMLLLAAVRRISPDFFILKETRREILEDLMDIESTRNVIGLIQEGKIKITEINTRIPSPFAFNIVLQGKMDLLKIEDKVDFLRRMHTHVLAKIGKKRRID